MPPDWAREGDGAGAMGGAAVTQKFAIAPAAHPEGSTVQPQPYLPCAYPEAHAPTPHPCALLDERWEQRQEPPHKQLPPVARRGRTHPCTPLG